CPVGDIASITVGSGDVAIEIIGRDPEKWHPATRETADHSLPFCVAAALVGGDITPRSFSPHQLKNPIQLDLMQKIRVEEVKAFSEQYPQTFTTKIDIHMTGGRNFMAQVDYPKGHPRRPLTDCELEEKFQRFAAGKISRNTISKLIRLVW